MANLVSDEDVREILDTDLTDLTPFIDTAHLEVKNLSYSEERKVQIEKWLAAHFASIRDKEVDAKVIEGDREDYAGETGRGYESTRYGQQALSLDVKGELGSGTKRVSFDYVGE